MPRPTRIYLAGPLFTTAERQLNSSLASLLRALGYEIWLPQDKEPREKTAKAIFNADVAGIDWADCVVANMDGPDPDSGTCWECGYAYAKGKPIVQFRTDFRSATDDFAPYNLMLTESATRFWIKPKASITDIAEVVHSLLCSIRRERQLANRGGIEEEMADCYGHVVRHPEHEHHAMADDGCPHHDDGLCEYDDGGPDPAASACV